MEFCHCAKVGTLGLVHGFVFRVYSQTLSQINTIILVQNMHFQVPSILIMRNDTIYILLLAGKTWVNNFQNLLKNSNP